MARNRPSRGASTAAAPQTPPRALGANASTLGQHILFADGQYVPHEPAGRGTLAHELTHVIQQRRDPAAGGADGLRVSDPQDPQEVAAEQVARTMTTPGQGPAPAFPAGAPERGGLGYLIQRQKTAGTPLQAAGEPFSRYDLTAVTGGAGWEADVGIAMVTLQEHEDNKHKSPDVVGDPSPNLEDYYRNSAPVTDLLGDVEAFGISMPGCSSLSSALRAYYLGDSRTGPGHQNRWHVFAEMSNLRYTVQAGKVIWKEEARKLVIQRIKAFADLYALREHRLTARFGKVRHQDWPTAGAFADRFLKDVAAGLGKELAAGAAKKP